MLSVSAVRFGCSSACGPSPSIRNSVIGCRSNLARPDSEIERRGFDANGRTVEFTRSYYRGDCYEFVPELTSPAR